MWKDVVEFSKALLSLTRNSQKHEEEIETLKQSDAEIHRELRAMAAAIQELRFERQRDRDNAEHDRKDAERAYENLVLRLENTMLRFERGLPAAPQLPAVEDE